MEVQNILQKLPELHAHIGASVPPHIYWQIAHSEGYKLPQRDYHEFKDHIVLSHDRKMSLKRYLDEIYHPILDKLSAGTHALETAVYSSLSGAYRSTNITLYELRGNPMKHNREGEVDLDHAIMAMLRGMERALLEYPKLRAGLIFCLDRQFSYEKNEIIVQKAIKYKHRGVIGLDFANYVWEGKNPHNFHIKQYAKLMDKAREEGLGVTVHSGEAENANNDLWDVMEHINPSRIGHGILAAYDKKLMKILAERGTILEVCPLSNLMTKAVKNNEELSKILHTFMENGVKFCINTDWPETVRNAHLKKQYEYLLTNNILDSTEVQEAIKTGFESTFIPMKEGKSNLYL